MDTKLSLKVQLLNRRKGDKKKRSKDKTYDKKEYNTESLELSLGYLFAYGFLYEEFSAHVSFYRRNSITPSREESLNNVGYLGY